MNSIAHPSHPDHPLILTSACPYPSGKILCDACDIEITGCFYRCSTCNIDIHIKCAMKPLVKIHNLHPHHPLVLTFAPHGETFSFSCAACHHAGTSDWLYRCKACQFNIHLDCPATHESQHSSQAPAPAAPANQCFVKGLVLEALKVVMDEFIKRVIFDG